MDHPVSALSAWLALFLFGLVSLFLLPFENLPEIDIPEYRIVCTMPGFPPEEMENLITIPLENALSGVQGVRVSEAYTATGISLIIIRLDWGKDAKQCAGELRECIDDQYPLLPESCSKPVLLTSNTSRTPVMTLALEPATGMETEIFYRIIREEFSDEIRKMEEISLIEYRGLRESGIVVEGDTALLSSLNLSLADCVESISNTLISRSAGKLNHNGREQLVKLDHPYNSVEDLARLRPFPHIPLALGEMADIKKEFKERSSLFMLNGKEAVGLKLYKSGNTGTLEASNALGKRLIDLKQTFHNDLKITLLRDYGDPLRASKRTLVSALFWGLAAVILILYILYRNPVIPLITALAVPATLLPVFFILYLTGKGINSLSLTGMIVGTGLIADGEIVVLENLETGSTDCSSVFPALLSSTMTTILVFLPPLSLPGATGVLFRDLIITIMLTVFFSLPVALFFSPALWSLCRHKKEDIPVPFLERRLNLVYSGLLVKLIPHPGGAFFLFLLFSLFGIIGGIQRPQKLLPSSSDAAILIRAELPSHFAPEEIRERAADISSVILENFPGSRLSLESGHEKTNLMDRGDPEASIHRLRFELTLDNEEDNVEVQLHCILSEIPGLSRIRIFRERSYFSSLLSPEDGLLFITAENRKELKGATLPHGYEELWGMTAPRLNFLENPESLNTAGINRYQLVRELQILLTGLPAGEIGTEGIPLEVLVRGQERIRKDSKDLSRCLIPSRNGAVALKSLGRFRPVRETTLLCRLNRRPCVPLFADSVKSETQIQLNQTLNNKTTRSEDAGSSLVLLFLLSLLILYLTLGMETGSFGDSLLLMICPPLSLAGGLITLFIFTPDLTLHAFIGLLILQGTAVNTGILLLNAFREGGGFSDYHDLVSIALTRFRPVLATTLSTTAALFPIIISNSVMGNRQADTAIALTGGLLTAAPLIMILLPSLYGAIHGVTRKI